MVRCWLRGEGLKREENYGDGDDGHSERWENEVAAMKKGEDWGITVLGFFFVIKGNLKFSKIMLIEVNTISFKGVECNSKNKEGASVIIDLWESQYNFF